MSNEKKSLRTIIGKLKLKESLEAASRKDENKDDLTVLDGETWMDKQAVLNRMHISERTLQNWRKKKLLRFARIGGRIYYRETDLAEMLRNALSRIGFLLGVWFEYF